MSPTISERGVAIDSEPSVLTEPIGGSPLSRAVQEGGAAIATQWIVAPPRSAAEWSTRASGVANEFAQRSWYDGLKPAIAANGRAGERLERVAARGGVVVTTGQQPGLFGGPLLTLAKALTARALADEIERETGRPAAPLFWAATDDADFDEAASIWLSGVMAREVSLDVGPPAGTPMALAPIDDADSARLLAALDHACGSAASADVVEAARRAYRAGSTVGGAYVQLLRTLLEPLEIGVLDASHDCVAARSRPLLERALRKGHEVDASVAARNREIRANGFSPQVLEVEGLTLVFAREGATKRRIRLTEIDDPSLSSGTTLSPTVLLRPVVERAILPTVAYVGGPAELAYFTQASAVAAALSTAVPLAVPRWSTTLVEPRIQRILDSLGLDLQELRDGSAVASRLATARIPEAIRALIDDLTNSVRGRFADLERAEGNEMISARAVAGSREMILARIQRLERRYAAAVKRSDEKLMRDLDTARAALFPDGVRQERAHAFLPYVARFGAPLIERMLNAARAHARRLIASEHAPSAPSAARPA